METLLLKTEGMSAYGLQTFDVQRRVNNFPTRSAIIGLLGAALGICRKDHHHLHALSEKLKIAVQVNQAGTKMVDYHTVQNFRSPAGKIQKGTTKPTYREYWCDNEYSFAITADKAVIEQLEKAVKAPVYTLFQGRKSCPLTRPLFEKVVSQNNPANVLLGEGSGQVFSDVPGEHQIATTQVRDLTTSCARKKAIRTVYICGKE